MTHFSSFPLQQQGLCGKPCFHTVCVKETLKWPIPTCVGFTEYRYSARKFELVLYLPGTGIPNQNFACFMRYFQHCFQKWYNISCRPVARGAGVQRTPQKNLPKGPLLATKWAKNGVFIRGLRGWGSKSSLVGSKRSTFGGFRTHPPPQKKKKQSWLRA